MPKKIIIRYAVMVFLLLTSIVFAETQQIKEHKVIKGDTLWDITKAELSNPFLWPKVWKENPQIANPDLIYPDQTIKIPLYLIQNGKPGEETAPKPASSSPENASASSEAGISYQETVVESKKTAVAQEQLYKGIKGVVLQDGSVIEGKIITMNAEVVKIRTADGKISSYSFIKEVDSFIHEE